MLRTRIIVLEAVVGISMAMALAMPARASLDLEGCTPGFWKQPHHLDTWNSYNPDDSFNHVFGVSGFLGGDFTLLEVLGAKGGGAAALGRHAVAAVLNAANPGVNFLLSMNEVIAEFQDGYFSGYYEPAKNAFELANDEGCPLR